MLLPTFHMALLLGIAGLILLLVTVRPDEQRWVRLCLAVAAALLLYLDWRTGLLMAASPRHPWGRVGVGFSSLKARLWRIPRDAIAAHVANRPDAGSGPLRAAVAGAGSRHTASRGRVGGDLQ